MIERLKQNHFWWYQGPMILWALALFTQSSVPGDHIPSFGIFTHDKLIHFFIYVVFAATVNRAIRNQRRYPLLAQHSYLFTFMFVSLFAASDEFHQYFVPNRNGNIFDWLADCGGAVLYLSCFWLRLKMKSAAVSV